MTEAYAPTGKSARFTSTWEWQRVLAYYQRDGLYAMLLFGSAGVITYRTNKPILRHLQGL